jgi:hypothetical protein
MERAKQQQSVLINRGLFLVRYASAEDTANPPMVKVAPDPASTEDISFLLHPDHHEAELWQPNACLVVRALTPGRLAVEVVPTQDGGSAAATVRIEPLTQGRVSAPLSQTSQGGSAYDLSNLRILGHVTGFGDQVVNANEWVAGPTRPLRIEGISIDWPGKSRDLEIRYAVKTAKPQAVSGRAMGLGSFAGTRGKAMPIVGLMLEISGPSAGSLQFVVDAIFLGAATTRISGRRIVAAGPTGREPLVGLRVALEKVPAAKRSQAKSATPAPWQQAPLPAAATTARPRLEQPAAKLAQPKRSAGAELPQSKSSARKSGRIAGQIRVFRSRSKSHQPVMA